MRLYPTDKHNVKQKLTQSRQYCSLFALLKGAHLANHSIALRDVLAYLQEEPPRPDIAGTEVPTPGSAG